MRKWFASVLFILLACQGSQRDAGIDELTAAVRHGDVAAVQGLIARGADPNLRTGVNGWPPLMHAVHKNQIGAARALLDNGARIDLGDHNGATALMMASGYGDAAMVQLLLSRGANRATRDRRGDTALDYALVGVADVDDFTLLRCQDATARLLAGTPASGRSRQFARLKRCAES
jgi:ankyrin repeat protein